MKDLPTEVLHQIFQYLQFNELFIIRGVSKSIWTILNSAYCWRNTLCIVGNDQFQSTNQKSKIPLTMNSCKAFARYLVHVKQVTTSPWHDFGYANAECLFSKLKNLETVDLSNNFGIDDQTISLLTSSCFKIKNLNLSNCRNLTEKSLFMVAQQCTRLISLNVSATRLATNKSWLVLCALCDQLQELKMANSVMLDWDLVGGILPPQLLHWDISNNYAISFDFLSRLLIGKEKLMLDIRNCGNITGEEVDQLRSINSAVTILANPVLRNHNHDGVREYLEYILSYS